MGVQLGELISPKPIGFENLKGRKIAIDAMNSIYQFLSIIRQPTGEPLKDSKGRVTSHLSGLLYRNANLIEYGILPIYVFDGKPPELKRTTVEQRTRIREEAEVKWKNALVEGNLEEARMYAQQASRFSEEMVIESKELLGAMGIPHVQAHFEGEAQAAYMVQKGDAWAVGSQDYDSLLFGSARLVRNITISGKRKVKKRNIYIDITPEIFYLDKVLKDLDITREQLIDISILVGTDYNPGGVEGIGPKKAFKLIKEHRTIEQAVDKKGLKIDFDVTAIRRLFLEYSTTDNYDLDWSAPDEEAVLRFLCDERDFSIDRVKKVLERLETKIGDVKSQSSLDTWF